jgi:hypothetical protein
MKAPLFLLAFLVVVSSATAQRTDTLRTETTTEDARISAAEVKRFIRYITRADVEEKTLVKVGIWPSTDRAFQTSDNRKFRIGVNFEAMVERKLSPSFSFLAGIDGIWRYETFRRPISPPPSIPAQLTPYDYYLLNSNVTELSWRAGFRYYYAKAGQIRAGLSANNFSGNYFSVQVSEPTYRFASASSLNRYTDNTARYYYSDLLLESPKPRLSLLYGIQRRLGKLTYADINAGPEIGFGDGFGTSLYIQLNAFIGFGW